MESDFGNMVLALVLLYFLAVAILAWRQFKIAAGFLILALPTYLIRFNIGPLPSTVLEITFGAIFLIWLIKYFRQDYPLLKETIKKHRLLSIFIVLFFVGSFIAALANPALLKALGIWRAYFLEPLLVLIMLVGRSSLFSKRYIIDSLALSSVSIGLLTLLQKIFGGPFPPSLWDDELFGRPTSFFTSPNAIGLFMVPVALLLLPAIGRIVRKEHEKHDYWRAAIFLLNVAAIMLSFSQGAWIALGCGIVIFALLTGFERLAASLVVLAVVLSIMSPGLRQAVLFKDQAGQNRLTLWRYSIEYLTESPRQFVLGSGLRRFFTEVQKPYYDVKQMERLIYPHNLILNFWLETGLLGMLAFVAIMASLIGLSFRIWRTDRWLGAALAASLSAIIVHGLVDVPYFKNDLAMLFWILAAAVIISSNQQNKNPAS